MTDLDTGAAAPETAEPTEPQEPAAVHPAWETPLAVVPESLRGPILEQIRKSDAEAKKAIEEARAGSIEPEWAGLAQQAKQAGVTPQEFIDSYNAAQDIRNDPVGFLQSFSEYVDQEVKAGRLTRAEGQQQKAAAADAVDEELDLDTPEARRIAELEAKLAGFGDQLSAREQAEQNAQTQAEALAYAQDFQSITDSKMEAAGFKDAAAGTYAAVMRIADSALDGDTTGTLTMEAAIDLGIESLKAILGGGAPAAAPAAAAAPAPAAQERLFVGGGNAAVAASPQAQEMLSKEQRRAAMLAEGARINSEE